MPSKLVYIFCSELAFSLFDADSDLTNEAKLTIKRHAGCVKVPSQLVYIHFPAN